MGNNWRIKLVVSTLCLTGLFYTFYYNGGMFIIENNSFREDQNAIERYHSEMTSLPQCHMDISCGGRTDDRDKLMNYSTTAKSIEEISKHHLDVKVGGSWTPANCKNPPSASTAIIIPYKAREEHLNIFIENIVPFLKTQKASFTIFVVEQIGPQFFNKGLLMNIAFLEVTKLGNYSCFIFHDIDLIPVNFCNLYKCLPEAVRRLAVSRNLIRPRVFGPHCLAGAFAINAQLLKRVNGFTNVMFGWGGEDTNAKSRVVLEKIPIMMHSPALGNYFHLGHQRNENGNPRSHRGMFMNKKEAIYRSVDGYRNSEYKLHTIQQEPLFTRIVASFPGPTKTEDIRMYHDKQISNFEHTFKKEKLI